MSHRGTTITHKRINLSLPEETVALIDRLTNRGDRSRFIDVAIRRYVASNVRAKAKAQKEPNDEDSAIFKWLVSA